MRIAMVHATLPEPHRKPGGVDVHVHNLAEALVEDGQEVHVFSGSPRPAGASYEHSLLPGQTWWRGPLRRLLTGPVTLNRLEVAAFDVVHLHGDDWFYLRRPTATVRTFYGSAWQESRSAVTVKHRLVCAATFPLELLASRLATRTYGISPAHMRPFGIDGLLPCGMPTPTPATGAMRAPAILFVGTWDGRKRGRELWEAFVRDVRPRHPDAELWMVADRCDSAPGVTWIERPDDAALSELYRRASVFCLPSSYEGFGIPYVEAMAHGTPVVATPNDGSLYVTDAGRYGIVVEPEDLGPALASLLADPSRRDALRAAGLQRAAMFSWPKVVRTHLRAYETAIADHRSRRANG